MRVCVKHIVHFLLLVQFVFCALFFAKFLLQTDGRVVRPFSSKSRAYNSTPMPKISLNNSSNNNYIDDTIQFETVRYNSDFCVAYNVTRASGRFRDDGLEPITLAVHSTTHYLRDIEAQCSSRNWNGPVSVALFVDRFSYDAIEYLHEVHRCSTKVNQKLSLHVVYRMAPFQTKCDPIVIKRSTVICSEFNATYRSHIRGSIIPPFEIYPINVMRNVARHGALSDIHMMADVEMVFSEGFAMKLKKTANLFVDGKSKRVLVVRRFEIDEKVQVPSDYQQLFVMIKAFRAFEFHHKYFPAGHTIEGLWTWFRQSKNTTEPYAWEMEYKSSAWEAQLILHRNDPYNPEYFPTRIRDQQSLVYEICRANYTFHLVSQVFNVHRGVKTSESNLSSAVLTHQRKFRRRAFTKYMRHINSTYPDTFRKCGKFIM